MTSTTSSISDADTPSHPPLDALRELVALEDDAGRPVTVRVPAPLHEANQRLMDFLGVIVEVVVPLKRQTTERSHAAQLKASPRRADMEADAGPAFAHYIRTDTAGARPIPPALLEGWLARGYLTEILPPDVDSADWPGKWRPGIVLDPFMGSGTTALVARRHGRHAIGIELNEEYAAMAADRNAQMTIFTA